VLWPRSRSGRLADVRGDPRGWPGPRCRMIELVVPPRPAACKGPGRRADAKVIRLDLDTIAKLVCLVRR